MNAFNIFVSDDIVAYDAVWILGDNFIARTSWPGFKLVYNGIKPGTTHHFIKEEFDYHIFCGSKYENNKQNQLKCIINALLMGINKHKKLPRFILIVLDDDLIQTVGYDGPGAASILGDMIEGLAQPRQQIILDHKAKLANKAKRDTYPILYWLAVPHHKHFKQYDIRTKFNLCLESVIKQYDDMNIVKIEEIWNSDDFNLVSPITNPLTVDGVITYWQAIDAAFKFNFLRFFSNKKKRKINEEHFDKKFVNPSPKN